MNENAEHRGVLGMTWGVQKETNDSLAHHGILGMKWGVRRYQNADGSLTAAGRKRYGVEESKPASSETKTDPRVAAKPASEMTDAELNQALNRLRMEQQYNEMTGAKSQNNYQNQKDYLNPPSNTGALSNAELQSYITRLELEKRYSTLTAPPPKKVGWGEKFVKETLPAVAMEVAREYTKSAFQKMLGLKNSNDGSDNDGSQKKNKNNGGNKQDNNALNKIKERLDRNEKQMSALERAIVPANNQKTEPKSLTKSQSSFADGLIKSMESSTSYKEHRNSIVSAAREAADNAREKKKQREQLQKRLAGYRSNRENARAAEQDRYTRAATDNSDYYRSMWTYGM